MPPLANPRHERFVQCLLEGKPANAAYREAGYKPHDGDCIRSEVTVESLLDELEHARQRADGLDQLSAAVKAISEKAKISGRAETMADIADEMLAKLVGMFRPVDERDRQGLIELLEPQSRDGSADVNP